MQLLKRDQCMKNVTTNAVKLPEYQLITRLQHRYYMAQDATFGVTAAGLLFENLFTAGCLKCEHLHLGILVV